MLVSKTILKSILDEEYGERIIKRGEEWVIPSFAKPSKMKCYVNIEKGTAIDFIGNQGYSSRQLVAEVMGLEFGAEVDRFISDYTMKHIRDLDLSEYTKKKTTKAKKPPPSQKIELPKTMDLMGKGKFIVGVRNYLKERGIGKIAIEKFHLSYCAKGHYAGRIIIPFIEDNEVIWFQARAVRQREFLRYDNPKGVSKNMIVYNIDAIDKIAIICEGPFDAMTVNGQAIMGSAMSDWQAARCAKKKPSKIVLVPDNDFSEKLGFAPGYVGAVKSIEALLAQDFPLENILIATVEGGKDLNDIGKQRALAVIAEAEPITFKTIVEFREKGAHSKLLEKMV